MHPSKSAIESANKNTQNSEMNSACFCLHFSSLKNSRKNGIINSEKIIPTEDSPCHTTKRRGMRFRHIMKRMILPETSLPLMTKNIRPHNFGFMPRRKVFCAVMAEAPSRNGQQALDEKFLEKLSAELSERRRRGVHCGYGCPNYGR